MSLPLQKIGQPNSPQRLHIAIRGAVQGVGFRPFIYRLAIDLGLVGWVNNSAQGVVIEVEGERSQLEIFLQRIDQEKPPRSFIQSLNSAFLETAGYSKFEIEPSVGGEKTAVVLPDIATCPDCLKEIFDLTHRRYRYPFTNCTNCGPRFSILQTLPYDRSNTTMQHFQMCRQCQAEYENPLDRRFHAQPNACPRCGPHLELWDRAGRILASHNDALGMAASAIRQGNIVAVKGLGGFHLMVDARCPNAIQLLRQAKQRPEKPFALMYPSLELIRSHCYVSELEEQLLRSPQAPIVLLRRQEGWEKEPDSLTYPAASVAPGNPYLGIMLPYTPLHHLLMRELGFPVVATSGNLTNEPICTDEHEALQRLGKIADVFLVHNRPIARPIEDSIGRVMLDQEMMNQGTMNQGMMNQGTVLRRARGYAPLPIPIDLALTQQKCDTKARILAVGAQLKNTIAFLVEQQVFISSHIGDLETALAFETFQNTITSFRHLYDLQPTAIACDLHPDYRSTQFAQQLGAQWGIPVIPVQHHYAHVLACMAEHQLEGSVLGIAWDGTGYGLDGTIWGGEFLQITETSFQRVACLRPFRLPGGEKAIREPRRTALGLLYECLGEAVFERDDLAVIQAFSKSELSILKMVFRQALNAPITSSAGRFFDAIASLLDLQHRVSFEGQAAMALEFVLATVETDESYKFEILEPTAADLPATIDWAVMVQGILADRSSGLSPGILSTKVHNTLVEIMVAVARRSEADRIVLTGGCFQNQYLTKRAVQRLQEAGFRPYWHQRIPPNDGGIALGQIMAALRERSGG